MLMSVKRTPYAARVYLLCAALLIAMPGIMNLYSRYSDKFLVGTYKVERSPHFTKSVIYVAHHNGWGAVGLVINKQLPKKVIKNLENVPEGFNWHYGGPVLFPQMQYVLINRRSSHFFAADTSLTLMSLHDYIKKYPQEWKDIQVDKERKKNFRIYLGYAGWNPMQLENEIRRGSWAVTNYTEKLMFETPKPQIWEAAMEQVLETSPPERGGT